MIQKIFLFIFFSTLTHCSAVELTYQPNHPVRQVSEYTIHVDQYLPSVRLDTTMKQTLTADVSIVDRSDLPVTAPPVNMLFTLRDLHINLRSNDKETSYHVNRPHTSLFLAEINDMIDEPIKLFFDDHFRLHPDTMDVIQLSKEIPILREIHPQSFIEELFLHQFTLANHDLREGENYTISLDDRSVGVSPEEITYTITKIDDNSIHATIHGIVPKTVSKMAIEIPIGEVMHDTIIFTVEGTYEGTVCWNRKNALYYTLDAKTSYEGTYTIAEWNWTMEMETHHYVKTKSPEVES